MAWSLTEDECQELLGKAGFKQILPAVAAISPGVPAAFGIEWLLSFGLILSSWLSPMMSGWPTVLQPLQGLTVGFCAMVGRTAHRRR